MTDLAKWIAWWNKETDECPADHPEIAGPNMDIGQCAVCGMPKGVKRPVGESFGWHKDDCSLDFGHEGYCVGGGEGHVIPRGWVIRG